MFLLVVRPEQKRLKTVQTQWLCDKYRTKTPRSAWHNTWNSTLFFNLFSFKCSLSGVFWCHCWRPQARIHWCCSKVFLSVTSVFFFSSLCTFLEEVELCQKPLLLISAAVVWRICFLEIVLIKLAGWFLSQHRIYWIRCDSVTSLTSTKMSSVCLLLCRGSRL